MRSGSLLNFNKVVDENEKKFRADDTYPLIVRLRHNVIKTGVRTINSAYSRISIEDVARKLHIDSLEDVKYILAKAISERSIEAELLPDEGVLVSSEKADIYTTGEPYHAYDRRIRFCFQLHDQCVRAMRYPKGGLGSDKDKDKDKAAEERLEREKQEEELAKEIAEEDDDFF